MLRSRSAAIGAMVLSFAGSALAQETPLAVYLFDTSLGDVTGQHMTAINFGAGGHSLVGYEGGAFRFDGVATSVASGLDINPSVHPRLTMGCWARPSQVDAIRHVISHDNGGFDRNLCIDMRGGGHGWSAFTGSGVLGYSPVVADEWVFLAVVYDHTTSSVRLHVNDQTFVGTGAPGAGLDYTIMGRSGCCDGGFVGELDNVFFIDDALTPERIEEIRTQGFRAISLCAAVWEHPRGDRVCPGSAVTFRVTGAGRGDLNYQWRFNFKPIEGATASSLTLPSVLTTDAGRYDCVVTNSCGSVTSNAAVLQVCPSDFNCSGFTNSQDFFDFLAAFFASEPGADFNGDASVNSQDFFDFLTAFFAGC